MTSLMSLWSTCSFGSGHLKFESTKNLFYHLRLVPFVAELREQIVGGNRAPGSGGVKFAVRQRLVFPAFADGVHNLPCGFHFVAADEERRVAGDGVEQQAFVG